MAPAVPGNIKPLLPYRLPIVLGNVLADPVVRVEPGVRRRPKRCQTDDRIGAFAEFIAVTEDNVATKPGELTMKEAGSSPLTGVTGWQTLNEKANLPAGQKVPSHAGSGGVGSGGVGTYANQLAKHRYASVATTTSTTHAEWAKRRGADTVIDYKKDDFAEILHDYDLVLVTLGCETLGLFG
ncbi:hypothetical protein AXA44_39910 [Rhodococcus sp. SC4]|nr:hypothetical protein AXA44_39910 [Rhodococcus sp. SC4]